jgi:electron transfer flavoprotein beta subunit
MKIVVCVKQVPATDSKIAIRPDGKTIDPANLAYVVNPYDEFAVEEALRIKEKLGVGEVTVVSLGPDRAQEALRNCLAMGADKAIHLRDDLFEGGDSLATARVLAAGLKQIPFDLLFFGKQAVDDDMGAVGIEVAELLNLPHVSVISKLEIDAANRRAVAHRRVEGGMEVVETSLPAVFTAHRELNVPRYASLPNIMKAKTKPLQKMGNDVLGLDPANLGPGGAKVAIQKMELPPKRAAGRILEGETSQKVQELVRILREDIKVL